MVIILKTIDYKRVYENIKKLKNKKKLMLVLKDNAYGFGLKRILDISLSLDIKHFAVKEIEEAITIRSKSNDSSILLLGKNRTSPDILQKYRILISVESKEELLFCVKNEIKYHLKINSKMNRLGIDGNIKEYITPYLAGVYIHNATDIYYECAFEEKRLIKIINHYHLEGLNNHIGGSGTLRLDSSLIYRIGSAIYEEALSMSGKIIKIRKLKKNQVIGYNHSFMAEQDAIIGICDLGYVDGLKRISADFCYINGTKYKFVGNKCMDMSFILIDEKVKEGDTVEIIGANQKMEDYCAANNCIAHEVYLRFR